MDYSKITEIEIDGVDTSDYPDFVDAYISYAEKTYELALEAGLLEALKLLK